MRIIAAIFILGIIFLVVDCVGSTPIPREGIVLDKHYKPSETHVGSGTDAKGNPIMTTSTTPEEHLVIVRAEGKITKVNCDQETFYSKKVNDTLYFHSNEGYITGWIWGHYGNMQDELNNTNKWTTQ